MSGVTHGQYFFAIFCKFMIDVNDEIKNVRRKK